MKEINRILFYLNQSLGIFAKEKVYHEWLDDFCFEEEGNRLPVEENMIISRGQVCTKEVSLRKQDYNVDFFTTKLSRENKRERSF